MIEEISLQINTLSAVALGIESAAVAGTLLAADSLWHKVISAYTSSLDECTPADNENITSNPDSPALSVVVYANCHPSELEEYIDTLMAQDYQDYEAIIICETTAATADELGEYYSHKYPNLRLSFIPPGSLNLSRTKLAFTLGIKSARGRMILTTFTHCTILSGSWLSEMMRPVEENPDIEIVLGYTAFDYSDSGLSRWYRQMDRVLTSAQWIGSALCGRPYRGDGGNLLFSRELFFKNKGYAGSVHLHPGADDIFVNEIATAGNTATVLSPDSRLLQEWGTIANQISTQQKESYRFTSSWLPRAPFLRAGTASFMRWIALLTAIACCIVSDFALIPIVIAAALLLLLWGIEIAVYRKLAWALGTTRLWWSLTPLLLWHPIGNFIFTLRNLRRRKDNYTNGI